jgi:hypothetical protein
MVRAGIQDHIAMQMTGHKTKAIYYRYDIINEGDMDEAAKKLNGQAETKTKSNDR